MMEYEHYMYELYEAPRERGVCGIMIEEFAHNYPREPTFHCTLVCSVNQEGRHRRRWGGLGERPSALGSDGHVALRLERITAR